MTTILLYFVMKVICCIGEPEFLELGIVIVPSNSVKSITALHPAAGVIEIAQKFIDESRRELLI